MNREVDHNDAPPISDITTLKEALKNFEAKKAVLDKRKKMKDYVRKLNSKVQKDAEQDIKVALLHVKWMRNVITANIKKKANWPAAENMINV